MRIIRGMYPRMKLKDEMEKIFTITIPMKPFSLNNAYQNIRGGRVKTKDCKAYENEFNLNLIKHRQSLREVSEIFDATKMGLVFDYYFFIPRTIFYTKAGTIAQRKYDRCNITKIPNDIISKFTGIDDGLITSGLIRKFPSSDNRFAIRIDISFESLELIEMDGIALKPI